MRALTRARGSRGQAATEMMIMMMFLLLMIFGLVHFSMFIATKQMLDYAAFSAARSALIKDQYSMAAYVVMDAGPRWNTIPFANPMVSGGDCNQAPQGMNRPGVTVNYRVPFGLPIFNNIPFGGIKLVAVAPCTVQPDISENGDNANDYGF